MIDIQLLVDAPDKVEKALCARGREDLIPKIEQIRSFYQQRKVILPEKEENRAEQKRLAKKIAQGKKLGEEYIISDIQTSAVIKAKINKQETVLQDIIGKIDDLLEDFPNIPLGDVPVGKSEEDNKVLRSWGEPPKFGFEPKDHVVLGEALDIIDIESASNIAGTRFAYLKGGAAMLEFALVQLALKTLTSQEALERIVRSVSKDHPTTPFIPVVPPVMIKPEVFRKMGRLSEQDKDERYHLEKDDLYLIGSAEHTLGPLHMNGTLRAEALPVRYLGFSTAFRREAGSYGKDTRGILRVHQFDKLEMESFSAPEASVAEQEFFVAIQEHFMQTLKLPYRVMLVCTGEMGAPDARQIDIETWMPGQNRYRETHTADLMTDYQARRLNIRYRDGKGKVGFVHMNDATAIAIGRTLIAILENYQQQDGSVVVPEALVPFVGYERIK